MFNDILGIYLDKGMLHYARAIHTPFFWKPLKPVPSVAPSETIYGSELILLKDVLNRIHPLPSRRIFLSLARNRFFVRDIQLPPMALEDALASVQGGLPINCHLPLEDVYYDILLSTLPDKRLNALIIYSIKKEINPILDVVRETGHMESLKGLMPLPVAMGGWFSLYRVSMPLICHLQNEGYEDFSAYTNMGCIFSASLIVPHASPEWTLVANSATERLGIQGKDCRVIRFEELSELPEAAVSRPLSCLPHVTDNYGAASVAAAVSGKQVICLDGRPVHLKLHSLWKIWICIAMAVILVLGGWTWQSKGKISRKQEIVEKLLLENKDMENQIKPLERKKELLDNAQKLIENIDQFQKITPGMYTCINEIARLVPNGTWFSRFTFQVFDMTLQGHSRDALKVLEALRTSALFEQVKLIGSVNKAPSGLEQFGIQIRIRPSVTSDEPSVPADSQPLPE